MNEDELIHQLRARLARAPHERVQVGIGDDAAVLSPIAGPVVVSVDAQVEGVHFDRRWLTETDVAHRGVSAALSDLAAMGADATAVLVSWEIPASDPDESLRALTRGLEEASSDYAVPIVGGNVSRGPCLAQHTTVLGEAKGEVVLRSGAREGDAIYVTGPIGSAAVGLRVLMAGQDDGFAARWRRPRARLDRADLVRARASACIDISDGLRSELGHLAEASGRGMRVELARVPTAHGQAERAQALGHDPDSLIAAGGEDYELLFTASGAIDEGDATRIGEVTAASDVVLLRADGTAWDGEGGFRHR